METEILTNQETQNTEKTFTQAQVDAIVQDRLKRDREKYSDYDALKEKAAKFDEIEAANKTELEKATEQIKALTAELDGIKKADELRVMRTKIATDNNIPIELLTATTEEECIAQAEKVKEVLSASGIPVTINDGGEISNNPGRISNGKAFEQWAKDKM